MTTNTLFQNATTAGLEEETDRLGGFQLLESNTYEGTIKLVYVTVSQQDDSSAQCVNTVIDYDGHEMTERVWVTNKAGENFYVDKKDETKKRMLPGFNTINAMCLMANELSLSEQTIEEKAVDIWSKEAGKAVPTNVPVITSLIGKPITAGIIKQIVNKQKNVNGKWVDTAETREENVTDKYFHTATKMTLAEARAGKIVGEDGFTEEDLFHSKWLAKNKGQTNNRVKEVKGGRPGNSGAGAASAASGGAGKALFGNKK